MQDPITLDALREPVLASDGHTYSLDALRAAMQADKWHRSPVTGEVLRHEAYPNGLVAEVLGLPGTPCCPVALFDPGAPWPDTAHVLRLSVPKLLSVEGTAARRALGLPDAPFDVAVPLLGGKPMVPPPPPQLREHMAAMLAALGLADAVAGGRIEGVPGVPRGATLEALLLAHLCAQNRVS